MESAPNGTTPAAMRDVATDAGVGLLGLGTVNSAVARRLGDEAALLSQRAGRRIVLRGAAVRDASRPRDVDLGDAPVNSDADSLVSADSVDIVVEAIGGLDPARRLLDTALRAGKHVVTANKAVVAAHGRELTEQAMSHGGSLRYGAAVGGAVPILELLGAALNGDRIRGVDAICNGTTNFILSRMSRDGAPFDAALGEAQRLGFAEADPAYDIDGRDAADKLALIAAAAWGGWIDPANIRRRGIRDIDPRDLGHAHELGCVVKLLARATWDGARLAASVQPTLLVAGHHPLAGIEGGDNGFLIRGDLSGPVLLTGAGAGGDPTAGAVVNDIVLAARDGANGWQPVPSAELRLLGDEDAECAVYIRVMTNSSAATDEVAHMLEDRGVPVVTLSEAAAGEVVVLTGPAPVAVVDRALETLDSMASVDRVAACMEVAGAD